MLGALNEPAKARMLARAPTLAACNSTLAHRRPFGDIFLTGTCPMSGAGNRSYRCPWMWEADCTGVTSRQKAAGTTLKQAPARPNASGAKIRQQAACAIGAA